ncbi:50S ribosomal protein L33 [Alphaproteobacteria bacterium endosymbiont of Tiliacea citrago]|uniref:50S ribosomal protein L33 n=1 Tax=Alphaproteobacteria bacterium endosymbiont of Tiliacea citrago TaxID=3077944 RepID=UPI00313E9996
MAKKNKKNLIKLVSTATKSVINKEGKTVEKPTGTFFVRSKNPKGLKAAIKIELMKFDPVVNKRVLFKEAKIK